MILILILQQSLLLLVAGCDVVGGGVIIASELVSLVVLEDNFVVDSNCPTFSTLPSLSLSAPTSSAGGAAFFDEDALV